MKTQLFSHVLFFVFTVFAYAQNATYKIEFVSNWSAATHPTDFPSTSAHWSPLIGATHTDAAPFLQVGILATPGVEQVAETGGTSIITDEINALIVSGLAYEVINGTGLSSGLGSIILNNVSVDSSFPYISLLTMIAPSPDWIAQINNLKLTDINGNWQTSISVDVYATDAGTDSGTTYTSPNDDTNPAENISSLENDFPFSDQIIGTFVFTLQQVLAISSFELKKNISIYPNPVKGKLFIKNLGENNVEKVELYSNKGQKIKVFNFIDIQNGLELNSISSGLYFLKLITNKSSTIKKVFVQ
jgi:hypothetical protein